MAFRLRVRIATLLVTVVLLVAVVLAGTTIFAGADRIQDNILAGQAQVGRGFLQASGIHFDNAGTSLEAAAQVLSDQGVPTQPDDEGALLLDSLVAAGNLFQAVFIVDADGVRMERPRDFPVPDAYHDGLADGTVHVDPDTGEVLMVSTVSGSDDPGCCRLAGLVALSGLQDRLFSAVQGLADGTEGALIVDGVPVAITPGWPPEGFQQERDGAYEGLLVSSVQGEQGPMVHIAGPAGQTTPLVLGLASSTIVPTLILVVVAGAGGVWASSRILGPLRNLEAATGRLEAGDLSARAVPAGAPDLQQVARRFNRMASALEADRIRLRRFQDDLEGLVEERTRELEEKRRDMELFFYGVSHDIKSPVLTVRNFSQLAARKAPTEVAELLEQVDAAGDELSKLIDELLFYARVEHEAPEPQSVDIPDLVDGVIGTVTHNVTPRGTLAASGRPMTVETDPALLRRAVTNLVENAARYACTDPDDKVEVAWGQEEDHWWISVEDHGPGLPESTLADPWRPFGKHHRRGGQNGGHGLGLSIVQRVTKTLGGRARVERSDHSGTIFKLVFPTGST